jgi:Heterokaryon incompatibility protein Het-C
MDTGTLSKTQPETIRILVWILSFLGFGYATAEFEVTPERLGVYRPEEHIDKFVALFPNRCLCLTFIAVPKTTTTTKMPVRLILGCADQSDQLNSKSILTPE